MQNNILKISGILSLIILVSCTGSVKKHWNCGVPDGKGCSTIEAADGVSYDSKKEIKVKQPEILFNVGSKEKQRFQIDKFNYQRSDEVKERIWFAPYIDKSGNQHEESYVRVIVESSQWMLGK